MEMTEQVGSRIQREFQTWYRENAGRFDIPLQLISRNRKAFDLSFVGITPVVSASLVEGEIIVQAAIGERFFDILADFEAHPLHTPAGYVCTLCEPDSREVYKTRREFWRRHMFEKFLDWVNGTLSGTRWVRLSSIDDGGTTWATLIRNEGALSQPDGTLRFIQQLKRLDGNPVYEGNEDGVTKLLIALQAQSA